MRVWPLEATPAITKRMPQACVHAAASILEDVIVDEDRAISHTTKKRRVAVSMTEFLQKTYNFRVDSPAWTDSEVHVLSTGMNELWRKQYACAAAFTCV